MCIDNQSIAGLKISVIPPVEALNKNGMFLGTRQDVSAHSANTHWLDCFIGVWELAGVNGVEIGTWDILPPGEADVVVGMTPVNSVNNAAAQKRKWPHLKAISYTLETALGSRYLLNERNTSSYDAIVTYNQHLIDNKRYYPLSPRAFYQHRLRTGPAFEKRKAGVLVATNYKYKFRSGLVTMLKGWKFSLKDWIDYSFCPGELAGYRAQVARECATHPSGGFDLYGQGWGQFPETEAKCLGIPKDSTLDYLGNYRFVFAFENHSSDCSLISERIWDALWSDTVPVYRGHTQIDRFIPKECYIDATQFANPKEMLDWLARCPKDVWSKYRDAGRKFVTSAAVEPFLPTSFAKDFLSMVTQVYNT